VNGQSQILVFQPISLLGHELLHLRFDYSSAVPIVRVQLVEILVVILGLVELTVGANLSH
jgi:hypothetical protein